LQLDVSVKYLTLIQKN